MTLLNWTWKRPAGPRRWLLGGMGTVMVASLAACASAGQPAGGSSPAPATPSASAEERTEVDGPRPRLVISTEAGLTILGVGESGKLDQPTKIATPNRPTLSIASDGRHVFLNQGDAGLTQVLDAGSWGQAHGDHSHYYTKAPGLRDVELKGEKPSHVISHGDRTAVFYDGTGAATVFRDAGLTIGTLDTSEVDAGTGAHHGVAVPLEESMIISTSKDGEANGVSVRSADGVTELARHENCPGLHGEATQHVEGKDGPTAVFGCQDGVLVVQGEKATHIDNPTKNKDDRVSGFSVANESDDPRSEIIIGNYGDEDLAVVDLSKGTLKKIKVGVDYSSRVRSPDGDAVVVTTDGKLRVINPLTGKQTAAISVLKPYVIPEDWKISTPEVAVVGDYAYVTDPQTSTVTPVDLTSKKVGEAVSLDSMPNNLVAVNTGSGDH